jgi:MFS family permease
MTQALWEALRCRSYLYLVLGFFTCGFQLAFITVHMPAYLADNGISAYVGGVTLSVIGLFNIVGSLGAGWLSARLPKRYILSAIYLIRALAVFAFIAVPVTPASAITFGSVMGLMWLSTIPPTNGLIAVMFGTRWLAMLAGLAFLSHQVGGFLGVLIGGYAYEHTGSYDVVWQLSILFGVLSAAVNLPIAERPVPRLAPAPA